MGDSSFWSYGSTGTLVCVGDPETQQPLCQVASCKYPSKWASILLCGLVSYPPTLVSGAMGSFALV